jgi:hypothetical protein
MPSNYAKHCSHLLRRIKLNRTPLQFAHMSPVVEINNEAEWKKDYMEELLNEKGDFYPFNPENFLEAMREMDDPHLKVAATCFSVANETNADAAIQCAYFSIKLQVNEYWRNAAERKANQDYEEMMK